MAVRIRVEPIAKDIALMVSDLISPAAQSRAIAAFAADQLREAQQVNKTVLGRVPPHTTHVDGRAEAALETVRPQGGVIVFEFELLNDILVWIGRTLQERSPVVSGDYRRGHTLFADGVEVRLAERIPQAEEYSFTNTVPYARKIEIGKTASGRDFVIQVPNRIYERTAKDARARFGNLAKIVFTYRGIVGGAQVNPARAAGRAHNASSVRFPTIVIRPNG